MKTVKTLFFMALRAPGIIYIYIYRHHVPLKNPCATAGGSLWEEAQAQKSIRLIQHLGERRGVVWSSAQRQVRRVLANLLSVKWGSLINMVGCPWTIAMFLVYLLSKGDDIILRGFPRAPPALPFKLQYSFPPKVPLAAQPLVHPLKNLLRARQWCFSGCHVIFQWVMFIYREHSWKNTP